MPSIAASRRRALQSETGTHHDRPRLVAPRHRPPDDRLDSWKEIAAYLRRDVTTVQRWEKREGMPVHRHVHQKMGSVYAFKADLDAWARSRGSALVAEPDASRSPSARRSRLQLPQSGRRRWGLWLAAAAGVALIAFLGWQLQKARTAPENPLADARFLPLTDFDGIEQAAAMSRDGRFVAFLSDRDGPMDVWVTQVGVGQFYNLTRGGVRELVNPSVRTLGFSPDGTLVTFWTRRSDASGGSAVSVWAVPVLGGQPRPYLEGVAVEFDWSARRRAPRLSHAQEPGDPLYVRDAAQSAEARQIFSAPRGPAQSLPHLVPGPGLHLLRPGLGTRPHGRLADQADRRNVRADHEPRRAREPSGLPEPGTLLYLASDADGSGPWIYSLDVERRMSRRVSFGIDRYTSLAASADGRRVVATLASPKGTLWRVPVSGARAPMSAARRIPLDTGSGSSPGSAPAICCTCPRRPAATASGSCRTRPPPSCGARRTHGSSARPRSRATEAALPSRSGRTGRRCSTSRTPTARTRASWARSLELQGAPAWAPDGQAITVAGVTDGIPRLVSVPLDGRSPSPLAGEYSVDPTWSPDGELVVFSGPDIGTTFQVKASEGRRQPRTHCPADADARRAAPRVHARAPVACRAARWNPAQESVAGRPRDRRRAVS